MKKLLSLLLAICLLSTALCLPASAATQFTDIAGNEWYAPAVNYCAENGYMSGIGADRFDPSGKVSRAQMAQILYNFSGQPDVTGLENPFTDVGNEWYRAAIIFAKSTGIVNGTSSTTYSPNSYITREQVAVMLMGYYTNSTKTKPTINLAMLDAYTDKNTVSSWAKDSVAWAIDNRIMSGTGNGKLDPKGTCTRAQLAQFIMNYCQNVGKPTPIEPIKPVDPVEPGDEIVKELIGDTQPLPEDWLPKGGYVQGGRKYNMYGIDITEVDGIPTVEEAEFMNLLNNYRAENGLPAIQWNQHAQILAEVRAQEMAWILARTDNNSPDLAKIAHARPDGSARNQCESEIGFKYLSTGNYLLIEELKIDELMIDSNMVASGKTINQGKLSRDHFIYENGGGVNGVDKTQQAESALNGWQNSPGHDACLLADMTTWGEYAYGAFAVGTDPTTGYKSVSYDTYAVNWVYAQQGDDIITNIPVDNACDWTPDDRINWNNLGFTLDVVPEETSISDFSKWLAGQNIQNGDELFAPLYGAWTYERSMDNIIRDMLEEYYMLENRNPSVDDLLNLTYEDMAMVKYTCVVNIGDKLVNGHLSLTDNLTGTCKVCGVKHADHYNAGRAYVDQWFTDTYGIDVSGVGNAFGTCTDKATGERFDAYSDKYFGTASEMKWQEWLKVYTQDF